MGTLHVTLRLGWWTQSVSQMSALWLLLPFLLGSTQKRPGRGALVGLVAAFSALFGYFLMGVSPAEGHPLTDAVDIAPGWIRSNAVWIAGALVTGPLFGYLGSRWRIRRSTLAAAIIAGAFLLEPIVRVSSGELFGPTWVWAVEGIAGAMLLGMFLMGRRSDDRTDERTGVG
jgi:hypothetical protein